MYGGVYCSPRGVQGTEQNLFPAQAAVFSLLFSFFFFSYFFVVGLAIRFSAKRRTEGGLTFSNGLRRKGDEVLLNAYVNKSCCMLVFRLQL